MAGEQAAGSKVIRLISFLGAGVVCTTAINLWRDFERKKSTQHTAEEVVEKHLLGNMVIVAAVSPSAFAAGRGGAGADAGPAAAAAAVVAVVVAAALFPAKPMQCLSGKVSNLGYKISHIPRYLHSFSSLVPYEVKV